MDPRNASVPTQSRVTSVAKRKPLRWMRAQEALEGLRGVQSRAFEIRLARAARQIEHVSDPNLVVEVAPPAGEHRHDGSTGFRGK